jgi:hypothetical protein
VPTGSRPRRWLNRVHGPAVSPTDPGPGEGGRTARARPKGLDPALRIVARTSSFAFKGRALSARQIAAQLGVAWLVEGCVRRFGDRIRIVVELVNGSNGFTVWTRNLDASGLYPEALDE